MGERVAFTHAATVVAVFVFRDVSLNIVKPATDLIHFFALINLCLTLISVPQLLNLRNCYCFRPDGFLLTFSHVVNIILLLRAKANKPSVLGRRLAILHRRPSLGENPLYVY